MGNYCHADVGEECGHLAPIVLSWASNPNGHATLEVETWVCGDHLNSVLTWALGVAQDGVTVRGAVEASD